MTTTPEQAVIQADIDRAERFGNAWKMNSAVKFGLANLLAEHRLAHSQPASKWHPEVRAAMQAMAEHSKLASEGLREAAREARALLIAASGLMQDKIGLGPDWGMTTVAKLTAALQPLTEPQRLGQDDRERA